MINNTIQLNVTQHNAIQLVQTLRITKLAREALERAFNSGRTECWRLRGKRTIKANRTTSDVEWEWCGPRQARAV